MRAHEYRYPERLEVLDLHGAGITDGFELSNMGARNKTWVLWKSEMCALYL